MRTLFRIYTQIDLCRENDSRSKRGPGCRSAMVVIILCGCLFSAAFPGLEKAANASNLNQLGMSYFERGQYRRALKVYHQALAVKPNDYDSWYMTGICYLELAQWTAAIPPLKQAARINFNSPHPWTALSAAYENSNRLQEAKAAALRALRMDPNNAVGHKNLGLIYGRLGNRKGALNELNWLRHNHTEFAEQLGGSLVSIDPSYRPAVDMAPDPPRGDFTDRPDTGSITLLDQSAGKSPIHDWKPAEIGGLTPANEIQGTWRSKDGKLWLTIRGNVGTWGGPGAVSYTSSKEINHCWCLKNEKIQNIRLLQQWTGLNGSPFGENHYIGDTVFVRPRGYKGKCNILPTRKLYLRKEYKKDRYGLSFGAMNYPLYKVGS